MTWILLFEQLLNGLQLGVTLFLMAAGLTLVFGIMNLVNLAHAMGVTSKIEPVLSFPLGTNDVTLAEVAKIYQTFVSGKTYRYYEDGWDLNSHTFELGYNHTLPGGWLFDVHTRYYKQGAVSFYSDLFERADEFTYMTRDKQLSDMHSLALGVGVSYEMPFKDKYLDKLTFNLFWDHIKFTFDNFRDARVKNVTAGSEPTYSYDADVLRMLLTVWY